MKAAICTRYGPPEVLQIRDVPQPVPGRHDLLVKVHAAAVTVSETYIRSMVPTAQLWFRVLARLAMGITKPRQPILGAVLVGDVVATGSSVRRFRVGQRVYAFTTMRMGAYAEYACVKESKIVASAPQNLTAAEAAALPYGGLMALYCLRKAGVAAGQRVFIYGASGAIGTAALQIAKHQGAHVTAACGPTNLDLVRSLGADVVLDYTAASPPDPLSLRERGNELYDRVIDAVGRRKTSALKVAVQAALAPGGRYVSVDDSLPRFGPRDLVRLTEFAEQGALRPVIDRRYPLAQVADAHRYVELRHKKGNVILDIGAFA
ncbi:MAG TPA: NAD(P)-dependent alcohol dehydrogenase [Gemmatimonadales bacterium]|nr:NAD(P)-dependent alcohol dehydrogenase [Gemmatimonadales bacterium]